MKSKNVFYLLAIILFLGLTACSNDERSDLATGRLVVKMTDAPFPHSLVAAANVTIDKIEIRRSEEGEGSPFLLLSNEEISLNLLDLTNGVTVTLADLEVPVGTYDLVRLYVKDAGISMVDGEEFDLEVPSGAQTGIKVFVNPPVVVARGLTSELLLDFDVSNSFVVQGNTYTPAEIKGFIFKPVIKATNLTEAGRLTGVVTDEEESGLEGAQISVFAADTLHTTSFTNENGNYTILGLLEGFYDVKVELEGYESNEIEDVEIVAGNATVVNFTLMETL
jgi:hypothetical protein